MITNDLAMAREAFERAPRAELESLAIAYAKSHGAVCAALGIEKPNHVDEMKMAQRIESMDSTELAAMLAPLAVTARLLAGDGS